jgi:TatD DNase family protein
LENIDLNAARHWLLEQAARPETVAIGEAGLDKATKTPWVLQIAAFECCVEVSEMTHKPLIVHCVRAFEEILLFKKRRRPQQAWILHGFDKHPQTAQSLLDAGFYLSFGAALFKPNGHAEAALRITPARRFFLETDAAEQVPIEAVYEKAAALLGMRVEAVVQQTNENYRTAFGQNLNTF